MQSASQTCRVLRKRESMREGLYKNSPRGGGEERDKDGETMEHNGERLRGVILNESNR